MQRVVKKSARIDAGDSVRLAVVSDTHSHPHEKTAERLTALAPAAILHGGDIGDLGVLDELATIAPVYAVRGNIDTNARELPDVLTIDVVPAARSESGPLPSPSLRILLTHIAVYGPKLRSEVAKLAKDERANLVVCGHSHVPFIGRDRGITVFNPGSVGPKRFSLPILFGTIDISPTGVKLKHIDVATGALWMPP